jgi:hypothetical protein
MCPKDLQNALEKALVERLCEIPDGPFTALRTAIRRRWFQGERPSTANSSQYSDVASRVDSLPEPVRALLLRHYVFLEAEESICFSMNVTLKQLRRMKREAVDYVRNSQVAK